MKKKLLLVISMVALLVCVFAITVSAAMTGSTSNEFGEKITIDGMSTSGMATDDGSRVVLQHTVEGVTYYNTYPANYIVTNKSYNRIDYTNINNALALKGETFTYDDTSVIRLEMPASSTNTNGELKAMSNLKELIYMPGSAQTTFNTQEFLNASFERVVIPNSITKTSNGNVFNNCANLKEVVFQEGFSCTSLGNGWFSGCTALETFTIPKSVTAIGSNFFNGCTSLKSIYMENVTSFGQYWLVNCTDGVKLYVSSSVTSFGQFSYNNANPKATVFYTGTYDGAIAIKNAGPKVIKNATLIESDNKKPDSDYVPTSPEAWTIVYNYNKCKAFYNNEHQDPTTVVGFEGAEYFTKYQSSTGCQRCKQTTVTDLANALFTYKGFSTDGNSIVYDIRINKDAITAYKSTGKEIKYGIVASQIFNDGALLNNDGTIVDNRVVAAEFSGFDYTILQIKILNVAENLKTTPIHCCAYVVDGSKVKYLYDTKDAEGKAVPNAFDVANQVSYSQIK